MCRQIGPKYGPNANQFTSVFRKVTWQTRAARWLCYGTLPTTPTGRHLCICRLASCTDGQMAQGPSLNLAAHWQFCCTTATTNFRMPPKPLRNRLNHKESADTADVVFVVGIDCVLSLRRQGAKREYFYLSFAYGTSLQTSCVICHMEGRKQGPH